MDKQDVIRFANENPVCFLATIDEDRPRVRAVLLVKADESGFYFDLLSTKQVVKQLAANPHAELCFYNNAADLMQARQLRVAGIMEWVQDESLTQQVAAERAFIDELAGQPTGPLVMIFRLAQAEAHFWAMTDVLKEHFLERVRF